MLEVRDLVKDFPTPRGPLRVLKGISLRLERGQALSIMGPSGGGKSTLLFLLGALDRPSGGTITLDGQDPYALDERALAGFRNEKVGFVLQDHCLLPQCTVLENVLAPTFVAPSGEYRKRAEELVARVGLSDRMAHRPGELSGGEKQRVAIARALIRDPGLLLCDEPTGNLDGETADSVASLLVELTESKDRIVVVVTHSPELAARFARRAELRNGRISAREDP